MGGEEIIVSKSMRCKQEFISPGPHVSPQEKSGSHMKQKMTQFVKKIEFFF